jgi:hypothetical protein
VGGTEPGETADGYFFNPPKHIENEPYSYLEEIEYELNYLLNSK